ncbi:DUF6251 family protein [Streptomyces sp. GSL17-111]|uniref:DUF6251 family protein n=1 Tax=Streptomyces sp. GSL17-111 TaxID=3121596 RepID=UPI0030F3FD57
MSNLPEHRHTADCGCYTRPVPLPEPSPAQQMPQVVHVHQAPPDRTVQRLALGAGMGAGTVAAGVFFGPLLVGALASMAVTLLAVTLAVAVTCWAVVHVVKSVGGTEGQAAAKTLRRKR